MREIGKRWSAVLLALTMLLPLASCGQTEEPEETAGADTSAVSEAVTDDPAYLPDVAKRDFGGETVTIFVQSDPCFRHFYDVNVTTNDGGVIDEAVYTRNRTVEDACHVVIADVDGGGDAAASTLSRVIKGGGADYDLAWLRTDYYFPAMLEGQFTNLYDVPELNPEKLYWDQNGIADYVIHEKLYGIMGDISTSANMFTHMFGVNKTVAVKYGIDMSALYADVMNGAWTWDRLLELSALVGWVDLNGDGAHDRDDLYAFGTSPSFIYGGFSAAGEIWISRDGDGEYVFSELTDRMVDVLDRIVTFSNDRSTSIATWNAGTFPGIADSYKYTYQGKFMENQLLFSDLDMGEVLETRAVMKDDFGLVPLPKYDEAQTAYSVFAFPFYPLLSVPTTVPEDRRELIGHTMELLGAESYKTLTPAFYDVAMGGLVLRDEESVKILDLILRSRRYELLLIHTWGSSFRSNLDSMILNGKGNVTSIHAKQKKSIESEIKNVRSKVDKLS